MGFEYAFGLGGEVHEGDAHAGGLAAFLAADMNDFPLDFEGAVRLGKMEFQGEPRPHTP